MLKTLRRNTKIIIWAVVISFTLWGAGTAWYDLSKNRLYAGSVFGHNLSRSDFYRFQQHVIFLLQRQSREINSEQVDQETWNRLVLLKEAQRVKIKVSDAEVRECIEQMPVFQGPDGRFDLRAYQFFIQRMFRSENARAFKGMNFEDLIRDDLKIQKLVESVAPKQVSDEALWKAYQEEKRKIDLQYFIFPFPPLAQKPPFEESQIRQYYEDHKDEFTEPLRFQLAYLVMDPEAFKNDVKLDAKEVERYYETHKEQYRIEPPQGKPENKPSYRPFSEVKSDAETQLHREKAFFLAKDRSGELAQQIRSASDLASKEDLPRVRWVQTDFLSAMEILSQVGWAPALFRELQTLEPGKVSSPLLSPKGIFILSIQDRKPSELLPFDKVKDRVLERLSENWREDEAREQAKKALEKAQSEKINAETLAKSLNLKVQETGLLDRTSPQWNTLGLTLILDTIFPKKVNEWIGPVRAQEDMALFQVKNAEEPTQEAFQKEKETFRSSYMEREKANALFKWHSDLVERAKVKVYELK